MSREIKFRSWCETYTGTSGIKKFMEKEIRQVDLKKTNNNPKGCFIGREGTWL